MEISKDFILKDFKYECYFPMPCKEERDLLLAKKLQRLEKKGEVVVGVEDKTFGDYLEEAPLPISTGNLGKYKVELANRDRFLGSMVSTKSEKKFFYLFNEWATPQRGRGLGAYKPARYDFISWGIWEKNDAKKMRTCILDWIRSESVSHIVLNLLGPGHKNYTLWNSVKEFDRRVNEGLIKYPDDEGYREFTALNLH